MESSQLSDHEKELQAFLESKSGVKEIADSGVSKIPTIFIHPSEELHQYSASADQLLQIPLIDLQGIRASPHDHQRRKEVAKAICRASETWGFFQIVNHGVPLQVLEHVLGAVRTFHEQPKETKMEFNTNDFTRPFRTHRPVSYLKSTSAELWRDSFMCLFGDDHKLDFDAIPPVSRGGIMEYTKFVIELKKTLVELMSEGLGLGKDFLARMDCMHPTALSGHYYPACPQPELTLGTGKHSDQSCPTVLLQDSIGGLQILHQSHWVDVPHLPGALIVNVGEVMQFLTNDKFKSVEHRVVAKQEGPRISVAFFFSPSASNGEILYGPIKELLSEDNPPKYMEVTFKEYIAVHREYRKHVLELKKTLCELLSEALGLDKNFLASIKCESRLGMFGHYHPPCPEPDLTLATAKHSDQTSLTMILQDSIGGLNAISSPKSSIPGAFTVKIGGLMQVSRSSFIVQIASIVQIRSPLYGLTCVSLYSDANQSLKLTFFILPLLIAISQVHVVCILLITNDKFKSMEHRVVAKQVGPRVSVAFFFSPSLLDGATLYGRIKELLSDDNPPKYKEVSYKEYMGIYKLKSSGGFSSPLPFLKL